MKRILLLAILLIPGHLFSQDELLISYDTISVSANRIPQNPKETGKQITVLQSKEIMSLPVSTADEVLRYLPGVEVQSRGAFGVQSDITLRGSTFSQVLILIDGVRVNDPLTGHFNSYLPVPLSEIERIEIIKGPAAAIYGPDAVGGVINFITKTFSPAKEGENRNELDFRNFIGENNLVSSSTGIFIKKNRVKGSFAGKILRSDGEEMPSGYNTYFDVKTFTGAVSYQINEKWKANYRIGYDYRDFAARYFYTRSPYDESEETVSTLFNLLTINRTGEHSRTTLNFSQKTTDDRFSFNRNFGPPNEHTSNLRNILFNHLLKIRKNLVLSGGFQLDERSVESTDRGNHEDKHAGVFLIASWYPVRDLHINVGLREDMDENYGAEFLPQVSTSYAIGSLIVRGAMAKTIRAADFTERYVSFNIPYPLSEGRNIGNPSLKAERSINYEVGFDYYLKETFKFSGTAFLRKGTNIIDYVLTRGSSIKEAKNLDPQKFYLHAENIHSLTTSGFETEISYRGNIGESSRVNINAGYIFAKNDFSGEKVASKYLNSQARHLVTTAITFTWKDMSLGLNGLWKERETDEALPINSTLSKQYHVVNAQASWKILQQGLHLNLRVINLLDDKYSDILGAPMAGRWFMGGFSFRGSL